MTKRIVHEKYPEFDQLTQCVVEKEPVDMGNYIYVGCEVQELPEDEGSEIMGDELY